MIVTKINTTGNVLTYNLKLRRFIQPQLQWISNKYYIFWVCVFSIMHPVCHLHAPYWHMWSVRLYRMFPHYLTNSEIFEKKKASLNKKVCFDFLYDFCLKHF